MAPAIFVDIAAQGGLGFRIVGIVGGERADGDVALVGDEGLVVVDVEARLRGVGDAPDHDRADLDRIAVAIIHLEMVRGEIDELQRHLLLGAEGNGIKKSVLAQRPDIAAEEGDDARFVGLDDGEAAGDEDADDGDRNDQRPEEDRRRAHQRKPEEEQRETADTPRFPVPDSLHRASPCRSRLPWRRHMLAQA
ncbi:MAG: hypothetical protein J0H34_11075 [Rhizobiales bacterium]|nr:hypothetical protein [Hyphomicrobiales bacterium]